MGGGQHGSLQGFILGVRILEKKGYFRQVLARRKCQRGGHLKWREEEGGGRLPSYLEGGGYRGPLPEFFKNECNVVHSEVRLLLSSRPRQGRIQEFLKGGGTHHVNSMAEETKPEVGGLGALAQKKIKFWLPNTRFPGSWEQNS